MEQRLAYVVKQEERRTGDAASIPNIAAVRCHDKEWYAVEPHLGQGPTPDQQASDAGDEKTSATAQGCSSAKGNAMPLSGNRDGLKKRVAAQRLSQRIGRLLRQRYDQINLLLLERLDDHLHRISIHVFSPAASAIRVIFEDNGQPYSKSDFLSTHTRC